MSAEAADPNDATREQARQQLSDLIGNDGLHSWSDDKIDGAVTALAALWETTPWLRMDAAKLYVTTVYRNGETDYDVRDKRKGRR